MIRIVTKRRPNGMPEEWAEYPARHVDEVTTRLALRFDAELMALKQDGIDLGVKRWTAAEWRIRQFQAEAIEKLIELLDVPAGVDVDPSTVDLTVEQAAEYAAWQADHPTLQLAKVVALWAAVNLGGGHTTLGEVLDLSEADYDEVDELPQFIEDEGKAPADS